MGTRLEVENFITSSWIDKRVASWVIGKLPLLEYGFTHPPCPVYNLSLEKGLVLENIPFQGDFEHSNKLVMSGGFEGTEGHLKVVQEMYETRALTGKVQNPIVLMLEPDSYIRNRKQREPLVNLHQRKSLWSTSGLVEAIIVLPDKPESLSAHDFYDKQIHRLIAPASWCVNIGNPHYFEIMNRGEEEMQYDLVRLFVHHIEVHTSFLNSTRRLTGEEVRAKLRDYLLELVKCNRYTTTGFISPEEEVNIYMERIASGL